MSEMIKAILGGIFVYRILGMCEKTGCQHCLTANKLPAITMSEKSKHWIINLILEVISSDSKLKWVNK